MQYYGFLIVLWLCSCAEGINILGVDCNLSKQAKKSPHVAIQLQQQHECSENRVLDISHIKSKTAAYKYCKSKFLKTIKKVEEGLSLDNSVAHHNAVANYVEEGYFVRSFVSGKNNKQRECHLFVNCDPKETKKQVMQTGEDNVRQANKLGVEYAQYITSCKFPPVKPDYLPSPTEQIPHSTRYRSIIPDSHYRPNVVLVLMDDGGVSGTGIPEYLPPGQDKTYDTPNIEKLAKDGMIFTQAYATSSVCAPSRTSLFTSRSGFKTHIRGNAGATLDYVLPKGQKDIFQVMKKANYNVGFAGKWGFCEHPIALGIDLFFGQAQHKQSHAFYPSKMHEYSSSKTSRNVKASSMKANYPIPANVGASKRKCLMDSAVKKPKCKHVERITEEKFLVMLDKFAKDYKKTNTPFFATFSSFLPHMGTYSDTPYDRLEYPVDYVPNCLNSISDKRIRDAVKARKTKHTECSNKAMMELYIDHTVGKIMEKLSNYAIEENTLVIFTSDNGPAMKQTFNQKSFMHDPYLFPTNGGGRGIKREMFEGGVRVPLVMYWKNGIESQVVSRLTSLMDIFPTIAHLAGADKVNGLLTSQMEGLSLVPFIVGRESFQLQHNFLTFIFCQAGYDSEDTVKDNTSICMWGIRENNRKIVYHENEGLGMYNLKTDPFEKKPVATSASTGPWKRLLDLKTQQLVPMHVLYDVQNKCVLQE